MMGYTQTLLAVLMLACVASAQQTGQPQSGTLTAAVCNSTTTKPTPTSKSYIFETCIVAKFASYLTIGQGKYIELNDGVVNTNSSTCEKTAVNTTASDPKLVINFACGQLEFEISRTTNDSKIFVKSINGFYKDGNLTVPFSESTPLFTTTHAGFYYKCNTEQAIPMSTPGVQLMMSNFAYEAYRTATGTDFYKVPEECALDAGQVSDLVRIGVGICLVALVVIVLIAYFVGRRRWSERSSYESV